MTRRRPTYGESVAGGADGRHSDLLGSMQKRARGEVFVRSWHHSVRPSRQGARRANRCDGGRRCSAGGPLRTRALGYPTANLGSAAPRVCSSSRSLLAIACEASRTSRQQCWFPVLTYASTASRRRFCRLSSSVSSVSRRSVMVSPIAPITFPSRQRWPYRRSTGVRRFGPEADDSWQF